MLVSAEPVVGGGLGLAILHCMLANSCLVFVMGIVVEWQSRLVYDEDQQLLVPKAQADHPNRIPEDLNEIGEKKEESIQYKEGEFFPVLCGNCRTQVAALDMIEEVYHFHGCLESS